MRFLWSERSLFGLFPVVFGIALVWLVACGAPSSDPNAPARQVESANVPENVLATFDDGEITADDLDQAMLALPASQRQQLSLESQDTYAELVRELAVDTLLLREAQLQGIDQAPEIQSQKRALERNLLVQNFLATRLSATPPTQAEIRAEYDRRKEEFQRSERRYVFHLFRRLEAGGSKEDLKAEVSQLRQRVLDGQGFSVLASRHSDSESRHREGQLGWFEPGQLDPDLEEVIFSLEEGVPSQPIVTADGVHLFLVDVVVEAKDLSLDEAKPQFMPTLFEERRRTAMADLVEDLDIDLETFQPTSEELQSILRRNNPNEVVLRVGNDYELRLAAFLAMLENDTAQRPSAGSNRPEQVLERVLQGEQIFQYQLANGVALSDSERQQVARQAESLLAFQGRQLKMRQHLDGDPEVLRLFFDDNRMRFTSPLRLNLRQLSVPLGERPNDRMALLERRIRKVNATSTGAGTDASILEALAADLGGEIEDIGWKSLAELRLMNPRSVQLISETPAGHYAPPFSTTEALHLVHVVERDEPSPLPYETARDAVRRAYMERHGQRLYEMVQNQILENASFALHQDHLDALLASGIAQTE